MSFHSIAFLMVVAGVVVFTMTNYSIKYNNTFTHNEARDLEIAKRLLRGLYDDYSTLQSLQTLRLVQSFFSFVDDDDFLCSLNDVKTVIPMIALLGSEIIAREGERLTNPLYQFAIFLNPASLLNFTNLNRSITERTPKLVAMYSGRYSCNRYLKLKFMNMTVIIRS